MAGHRKDSDMTEVLLPAKGKAAKPFRDALRPHGLRLVEVRCYAVIRKDGGEEVYRGSPEEIFKWIARQEREGWRC